MNAPHYCDGIESISLAAGMVRLELFVFGKEAPEKGKTPERHVIGQIVMPPQGFLQAYNGMQRLMAQLEKQGLVRRDAKPAPEGGKT